MAAAQLTIGDVTLYNDVKKQVGVTLTNDDAYVGFQFDLYLPDGISVDSLRGTGRLPDGTTPQMAPQADGSYRVIAAAMNANAITGSSGDVLTLVLSASGVAAGQYTAYMRNVKVSRADGSGDVVAEQPFTITVKDGEAYAVLDGTTLTFYYDKQMESRGGMTDWSNAATATSVVNFDASFASYQPTSTAGWFKDFTSLTAINGIEHLKTDAVTDMSSMFQGCESLTALDLSGFNTSEVTTMYNMFMSCRNLETLDVSTFNTAKVTDMSGMFSDCIKLTELDLRYFQTANVETTMSMFYNCTALKTIYVGDGWNLDNLPVDQFNTTSLSMFEGCTNIIGGAGTVYDANHIDKEYARIDLGAAAPGYLTSIADMTEPATVTFSRDMYQLTMVCETANVNIMYAVVPDGSAAAPTWQQYGGPVTLTEDCTVRAYAERPSGLRSAETEYTFKMSDVSTVERPVMSWSGDDMSLTTSTEGATIYYTAEVGGTAPTIETYTAPVAITQDCVLSAWAAKAGLNNSDTLVVDYPYTAWQQLQNALGAAQAVAQQAQTSPRISDSMRGALAQLASEGQTMYNERTATEAEIIEKANHIYTVASDIQQLMDEVYEPYAVLSADSLTVTFYYDGQKTARGGMDINSNNFGTSPYGSATTAVFDASFADYYPTSTAYWFSYCSNLAGIDGMANLKTDDVTDMGGMFFWCSGLTSLDVSGFNTANVTDMGAMFSRCSSLTSLDLSGFNTANVTDMRSMFYGCSGLTSLDLSGFNTDNVTNMGAMFMGCSGLTSLDVSGFNTANVTGMSQMFLGCSGLTSLDVSGFNTANVTAMSWMFSGCSGLTSLDVSGFNTANVTDMGYMFRGCSGLTSLDLSGFNTANVTDMGAMFQGCSGLTSLDVSGFNTANVTNMRGVFYGCSGLTTIYVGEEWSTEKVTDSSYMFSGCTALVGGMGTVYDADHVDAAYAHIDGGTANPGYLTSVDAPSSYTVTLKAVGNGTVKTADITVANGGEQDIAVAPGASLTLAFTPDAGYRLENVTVDDTDVTSQVTADSTGVSYYTLMSVYAAHTVTATFVNDTKEAYAVLSADGLTVTFYYDSKKAERGGKDINVYNVSSSAYSSATTAVIDASFADYYPTSTSYWFKACSNLTSIEGMANLKTDNVTSMVSMFDGCSGLTSLDVSGFNTANVTSMYGVFSSCSGLTSLDVSGFNTANVTIMFGMFSGCSGLTSLDLSGFNTDNVTSMRAMFRGCSGLTNLDVSGFNTANVTDMGVMFDGCSGLTNLDLSSFNTANVTGMGYMFYGCSGLTSLDLSSFNTANVTSMNSMFSGCSNLTIIYVGEGWNTEKVTESTEMFTGCTALVGGAWTAYDNSYVEADYAHIDGGTANPGYLTSAADATVPAVVTYSRVGHTVTLSSATENVHIMYTLSTWPFADDEPQWEQYTDPLALTGDCTITAYAVRPSGLRSADTEYNFVLNANFVEAPTIARDGEENRVVITNNSTTGTVYYNYDANGQLTATNSSQYVGPIDVSQNVRINAAVIIDGVVSSDITSFTVDWFKVATPTYTWDADKLTATTTTDGATVEVSLTLPGDSVAAQVSGGVQTAIVTVEQDVRIDIRAMKDGWTDADVVSFDYPYTAWMQLMQAVDHGHQTMAAAAQSDKVDTVSPDAPYARLNALLIDAEEWYALRTAERLDIEELTARIQMAIAELEQEMNAVDEFAYDADNGVLHVYGNGLLEDALAAAGGREEVAQTLTAILWDKTETPLTDDMLQGLTDNPNLLIYVPTIEQAPVTVHNVVVGDRAEDILLVDATEGNSNFYCPRTFMADRISYTRSFTQQTQVGVTRGWESIVLPFTVQTVSHESHGQLAPFGSSDSDQHFWLRQLSADGLERATQIEAYRPYLISMPNDSANYSAASCHAGRVTFSAAGAMVEAGAPQETMLADDSRILIGTTKRMAPSADIYVLNVGQPEGVYLEGSIFVSHLREARPFECYTLHPGGGSRYIGFGELDGSATLGIDGLTFDGMPQEQWFTLDGMKLQQRPAAKGVYILNGRKVVIK